MGTELILNYLSNELIVLLSQSTIMHGKHLLQELGFLLNNLSASYPNLMKGEITTAKLTHSDHEKPKWRAENATRTATKKDNTKREKLLTTKSPKFEVLKLKAISLDLKQGLTTESSDACASFVDICDALVPENIMEQATSLDEMNQHLSDKHQEFEQITETEFSEMPEQWREKAMAARKITFEALNTIRKALGAPKATSNVVPVRRPTYTLDAMSPDHNNLLSTPEQIKTFRTELISNIKSCIGTVREKTSDDLTRLNSLHYDPITHEFKLSVNNLSSNTSTIQKRKLIIGAIIDFIHSEQSKIINNQSSNSHLPAPVPLAPPGYRELGKLIVQLSDFRTQQGHSTVTFEQFLGELDQALLDKKLGAEVLRSDTSNTVIYNQAIFNI